jgi:hypothetical protein
MGRSYYNIVEDMRSAFLRIYDAWDEKRSDALALRILEEDIAIIGCFFGAASKRALYLCAQCIVVVKVTDDESCSPAQRTAMEEEVLLSLRENELYHTRLRNFSVDDVIEHCKSWMLIKELKQENAVRDEDYRAYQQHNIELIDLFFAATGSISEEQMRHMARFERLTSYD